MTRSLMLRTDRSVPATDPISAGTFVPYNAVLFYFSPDWNNDYPKDLNLSKYYRKFNELLFERSVKDDGSLTQEFYGIRPFIYCSNSEVSWQSNTAIVYTPNNDLKLYDNLFAGYELPLTTDTSTNRSGRHGYLTGDYPDAGNPNRLTEDLPYVLGREPGEEPSEETYKIHDVPHTGHQHFVSGKDLCKSIEKYKFLYDQYNEEPELLAQGLHNWQTFGLNVLPVIPIIRDPKIDGYSKKLTYLPKNVLVFAENLNNDPHVNVVSRDETTLVIPAEGDYTRGDYIHDIASTPGYSASYTYTDPDTEQTVELFANTPIYIVAHNQDMGVLKPNTSNTFNVTVSSNASGLHTHESDKTDFKSTGFGVGTILGASGLHTHEVTYTVDVNIKSKWLNGWVTLKDETPIANGIIIAFSPKGVTSYRNPTDHTDWLPPYWHFCDGTNGTPDLRSYAIAVNMYESQNAVHNTVISSSQNLTITNITVNESTGEVDAPIAYANGLIVDHKTHTHILDEETGFGTSIPMPGSHGTDPNRWHTHQPFDSATFTNPSGTTSTQLTVGTTVKFLPARTNLAFIMYNSAIP